MNYKQLGNSDLNISNIGLGTMMFGEQVNKQNSLNILDTALDKGINFIDTAEMYSAPTKKETYGLTESIIGNWLTTKKRDSVVLASKVSGPNRGGQDWIRSGPGMTGEDIIQSCEGSLSRLKTDYIDLFQIHWPERYSPKFGELYYDPEKDHSVTSIHEQLLAFEKLIKQGKIRYVGLANETPYGVHEFIRLSDLHNLPRIQSLQNHYSLTNRSYENGLDEILYKSKVGMIAYSPLSYGMLTGKYDNIVSSIKQNDNLGRLTEFIEYSKRRWCCDMTIKASKSYNSLAREIGLTPVEMALSYCYHKWSITTTLIGVTSIHQLNENIAAKSIKLSKEVLHKIDDIRWEFRDPTA
jgi:aryl-alcohol dehydrogenase-like predicted oxidoreductase